MFGDDLTIEERRKQRRVGATKKCALGKIARGLCKACGKPRENLSIQHCTECRDKKAESEKKRNENNPRVRSFSEEQKQQRTATTREFQKDRVARGLCMRCGAVRENQKHQNCNKCKGLKRQSDLKDTFGITIEEYEELSALQGHVCSICKKEELAKNGRLHVDHDHKTGKVRGLLCKGCNMEIGSFDDSPELLRRAAKYIEENKG